MSWYLNEQIISMTCMPVQKKKTIVLDQTKEKHCFHAVVHTGSEFTFEVVQLQGSDGQVGEGGGGGESE